MYQVRSFNSASKGTVDCFIRCLRLPSLGLVAVLALVLVRHLRPKTAIETGMISNGLSRPCFVIVLAQQDGRAIKACLALRLLVSLTSAPWWGVRLHWELRRLCDAP